MRVTCLKQFNDDFLIILDDFSCRKLLILSIPGITPQGDLLTLLF